VFAAAMEICTGLALLIVPAFVVGLLLGADISSSGAAVSRYSGITLFALGLACWPSRRRTETSSSALRAMLAYNALIPLYLAYCGVMKHFWGLLLWPAVGLHAAVALWLLWASRAARIKN
jgi:hypothetical protein